MSDTSTHSHRDNAQQSGSGGLLSQAIHLLLAWLHISLVAPVALLIDGDNSSSDRALIAQVLVEAGKFGGVTIRRVYGNWSLPTMHRWRDITQTYGFEERHHGQTAPGKNATDIALAVDAIELYYRDHITHFCLVTSDSDYTPLVLRLRQAGCLVLGIGEAKTPLSLMKVFTIFISTEQLTFPSTNTAASSKQQKKAMTPLIQDSTAEPTRGKTQTLRESQLTMLLVKAYTQATGKIQSEWVPIPQFGATLKQLDPEFKAGNHGHKDLPTLVKNYADLFDTRKQTTGKTKHVEVRLRKQNAE
ncbi:MAG: NYN domain-containing protein [Ktedonobacteraceae bacterium]